MNSMRLVELCYLPYENANRNNTFVAAKWAGTPRFLQRNAIGMAMMV